MEELIDLHTHSIYSDGEYEPEELVNLAKEKNIKVLSITDHDTLEGTKKLANLDDDIFYIHGIELSAKCDNGQMHILGYNMDLENEELNKMISKLNKNRAYNTYLISLILINKYGLNISNSDLAELFTRQVVGRPHLAKLLVKRDYVRNVREAFDKYLISAYDECKYMRKSITKEEIIATLKSAGAYVSLAHPKTLNMDLSRLRKEIEYLKSLGLDAIEIQHESQNEEYRDCLREIALDLELFESGGTDFHGPNVKPSILLGTGVDNNIKIKQLSLVDEIKKRA